MTWDWDDERDMRRDMQEGTTMTITTYYVKRGQFANAIGIVRCDDPAHVEALEADGYERISRANLRKLVTWVNGENDAWGSNRAFGRIDFTAITNPEHRQYHEYGSAAYLAERRAYA